MEGISLPSLIAVIEECLISKVLRIKHETERTTVTIGHLQRNSKAKYYFLQKITRLTYYMSMCMTHFVSRHNNHIEHETLYLDKHTHEHITSLKFLYLKK